MTIRIPIFSADFADSCNNVHVHCAIRQTFIYKFILSNWEIYNINFYLLCVYVFWYDVYSIYEGKSALLSILKIRIWIIFQLSEILNTSIFWWIPSLVFRFKRNKGLIAYHVRHHIYESNWWTFSKASLQTE